MFVDGEGTVVGMMKQEDDPNARKVFADADRNQHLKDNAFDFVLSAVEQANDLNPHIESRLPVPTSLIEVAYALSYYNGDWSKETLVVDCETEDGQYVVYTLKSDQYMRITHNEDPKETLFADEIPVGILNMIGEYRGDGVWKYKGAYWEFVPNTLMARRNVNAIPRFRHKHNTRILVTYNGQKFMCAPERECELGDIRIEGTGLVLKGTTGIHTIYKATCETFDYALPQPWVDENYLDKGLPMPRGVWCYSDDGSVFGEFLPYEDAVKTLAEGIKSVVRVNVMEV
jgi:hypothetical protein